jgi:hypothetical protein
MKKKKKLGLGDEWCVLYLISRHDGTVGDGAGAEWEVRVGAGAGAGQRRGLRVSAGLSRYR